ncbi:MAG: PDZ domain-containing protein [Pirellulaceae bacterium]
MLQFRISTLSFTVAIAVSSLTMNSLLAYQDSGNRAKTNSSASTSKADGETDDENQGHTILGVDLDSITSYAQRMRGDRKFSRISPEIVELMKPVISSVSSSTVRVYSGKHQLAIGTVVDSNGLILTVADELKNPIECRLPDGSTQTAKVYGIDRETGLAMLKVNSANLNPINWSSTSNPEVGDWLASASPDQNPVSIGVVSVLERKISSGGAFIGITMQDMDGGGVRINTIVRGAPADKADLRVNDVIVAIDSIQIQDQEALREQMQNYSPGDQISMTFTRRGEEQSVTIELAARNSFEEIRNQQEKMGSTLSKRRQGFAMAFQHDSFLQANDCGSPVVDIEGRLAGINISRSGRVSSLALPIHVVIPAIERLKTGQLAPEIVNATRIDQIEEELRCLEVESEPLPNEIESQENGIVGDHARIAELRDTIKSIQERLEALESAHGTKEKEITKLKAQLKGIELRRLRLKRELDQLQSGAR